MTNWPDPAQQPENQGQQPENQGQAYPPQPQGQPPASGPGSPYPQQQWSAQPYPGTGPAQWQQPSQPGYGYGAPHPKKKKTGLIIGAVVGALLLLGLIGGGVLLAMSGDDDSGDDKSSSDSKGDENGKKGEGDEKAASLDDIDSACPLLDASFITEETSIPQEITPVEGGDEVVQPPNSKRVQCEYMLADGSRFLGFQLTVYAEGACEPQECIDQFNLTGAEPVSGVGDAAVFLAGDNGELLTVKDFSGRPVSVVLIGPGPNTTADTLSPFANEIFKNVAKG